ncbi:MAG TPA: alpha/beta hydrolase [Runella sp.]|nr:alpha/beta hydrolase [Runella sp.]HAO50642.1 alpha/beta hydrolase [Runella sp.]
MPHFVDTNGIKLHYLDSGGDKTPLLLMHGLTANAHAFDGLIKAGLSDFFRVISVDLRGRGLSDKPSKGYTMKDHAQDMLGLMDALGFSKITLGGHSFGGLLTFYMGYHHADCVEKMVILDAAAQLHPQTKEMLIPTLGRLGQTYPSFEQYIQKIKSSPYMSYWEDTMLSYYQADVETFPDGSVQPRSRPENMTEAILKGSFGEPWLDYIRAVSQPSILVNGSMDYALGAPLLPKDFALDTVKMMHDCRYVEVKGNHQTMLYGLGAAQTVEAMASFLR